MFVCGKNTLYILMGIELPSLPVYFVFTDIYILTLFCVWLCYYYWSDAVKTENFWSYHIKFLCCHLYVLTVLANVINCYGFCIPAQSCWSFLHLKQLLPYTGNLQSSCVFLQYLHLVWVYLRPVFALSDTLFSCHCFFHSVKIFTHILALIIIFWALCASILQAHINTCLLVILFVFFIVVFLLSQA